MVGSSIFAKISTCGIIKPFYVIVLSLLLNHQKYNLYFKYLLTLLLIVPIILLLMSQPDIGQSILIVFTWLTLIFISGINLLFFLDYLVFSSLYCHI